MDAAVDHILALELSAFAIFAESDRENREAAKAQRTTAVKSMPFVILIFIPTTNLSSGSAKRALL
jgi:hypothetical protein